MKTATYKLNVSAFTQNKAAAAKLGQYVERIVAGSQFDAASLVVYHEKRIGANSANKITAYAQALCDTSFGQD